MMYGIQKPKVWTSPTDISFCYCMEKSMASEAENETETDFMSSILG